MSVKKLKKGVRIGFLPLNKKYKQIWKRDNSGRMWNIKNKDLVIGYQPETDHLILVEKNSKHRFRFNWDKKRCRI